MEKLQNLSEELAEKSGISTEEATEILKGAISSVCDEDLVKVSGGQSATIA